jgi:hypothetical protein
MHSKVKFKHRALHLNNKVLIHAQRNISIEVDLLFVKARTATLNWEIPIGVPGLGVFWGYFDTMAMWQHYFG